MLTASQGKPMLIVTIDAGTTNTRVRLWRDKKIVAASSKAVGVRDIAVTGDRGTLMSAIKSMLESLFRQIGGVNRERYAIVASGMITAELGLHAVPHLTAPVSFADLAAGAVAHILPEIAPQPIWFIPGVKNAVASIDVNNIDAMDMMRGEEVETFGLLAQHHIHGPVLVALPGTHSKFVLVDKEQRILSCVTTMAGELLDVLTHQTILKNSLDGEFTHELDREYLLKGAASCRRLGISRSCFAVRLLDRFTPASHCQKASYLLGAAFYSDLQALKHSAALDIAGDIAIAIGGKSVLQQALATLIADDPFFSGSMLLAEDRPERPFSGSGAVAVMEQILMRSASSAPLCSGISPSGTSR